MKKLFLTAALSLILTGTALAVPAEREDSVAQSNEITIVEENVDIEAPTADVDEPTIPESTIAKKMTQAEKAQNAAENDSWGGAITIIAMSIVILALVILSILFLCFGKVSEFLMEKRKRKTVKAINPNANIDDHGVDSGEVIAAIAMALSEHFGESHDMEDTILTIKRMKRAYSPWNSKIYNLRNMPDHHRNASSGYPIKK